MFKKNHNDKTLKAYNRNVDKYIKNTPIVYQKNHAPLLKWIDASLQLVPPTANILEIGSGTGRETSYIQNRGYKIQCSDGAKSFVNYLKREGQQAYLFNVLKDNIVAKYDMILANAVITHFTPDDLRLTLKKVHGALNKKGIFAFSAKQGHGEEWTSEKFRLKRYIRYWQAEELIEITESFNFKIVFLEQNIPGDIPSHIWINMTIQKVE